MLSCGDRREPDGWQCTWRILSSINDALTGVKLQIFSYWGIAGHSSTVKKVFAKPDWVQARRERAALCGWGFGGLETHPTFATLSALCINFQNHGAILFFKNDKDNH